MTRDLKIGPSVAMIAELRSDMQVIALRLADLGFSEELMAVNEAYVRLGRRYPEAVKDERLKDGPDVP